MKKVNLLENLKTDEFKAIHHCVGGERIGTGNPGDRWTPCTADSVNRESTPVAGQNGASQWDFSDLKDECLPNGTPTPGWWSLPTMPQLPGTFHF